jgi:hypothetical protein
LERNAVSAILCEVQRLSRQTTNGLIVLPRLHTCDYDLPWNKCAFLEQLLHWEAMESKQGTRVEWTVWIQDLAASLPWETLEEWVYSRNGVEWDDDDEVRAEQEPDQKTRAKPMHPPTSYDVRVRRLLGAAETAQWSAEELADLHQWPPQELVRLVRAACRHRNLLEAASRAAFDRIAKFPFAFLDLLRGNQYETDDLD